jgi:hypothetical protein
VDQYRTLRGVQSLGRDAAEPETPHRIETVASHGHEGLFFDSLSCCFEDAAYGVAHRDPYLRPDPD